MTDEEFYQLYTQKHNEFLEYALMFCLAVVAGVLIGCAFNVFGVPYK